MKAEKMNYIFQLETAYLFERAHMLTVKPLVAALILGLFQAGINAADLSYISTINCASPKTTLARSLCVDSEFIKLDEKLKSNYLAMISSDIGEIAKKDLKLNQEKWRKNLKKCTNSKCVEAEYKKRINAICEYPMITGVYPVCELVQ